MPMQPGIIEDKLHLAKPYDPTRFEQILVNAPTIHIGAGWALQVRKYVSLPRLP